MHYDDDAEQTKSRWVLVAHDEGGPLHAMRVPGGTLYRSTIYDQAGWPTSTVLTFAPSPSNLTEIISALDDMLHDRIYDLAEVLP